MLGKVINPGQAFFDEKNPPTKIPFTEKQIPFSEPTCGWPFNALLSIANRLSEGGHSVELVPPHLSLLWGSWRLPYQQGFAETSLAFRMFFQGIEYYTRYVVKQIEFFRPDVLVADFAFPAASLAADIAALPYATVYHSGLPFRGPGIPPFGSGLPIQSTDQGAGGDGQRSFPNADLHREKLLLDDIDKRMAKARRVFGLAPVATDLLRRPYSPWLNLVASASVLEAPRDNLTANTFFYP